jgi:hypothetical protein
MTEDPERCFPIYEESQRDPTAKVSEKMKIALYGKGSF